MKTWILIIWEIIKALFGRKEPTEKDKIKKRIKELNCEIKKYNNWIKKARKNSHPNQLNTFADKLRILSAERDELQKILCE